MRAQILACERALAQVPGLIADRKQLAQLYKLTGDCRDDIYAYQAAIDLLEDGAAGLPNVDAEVYVLRAGLELSLHRLSRSQTDLERARTLGGDQTAILAIQVEIDWNLGKYDAAARAIRQAAVNDPSTHTLARLAQLEHECGRDAQALAAFAQAEIRVRSTMPFTVAWLNLQRAVHAEELGALDQAVLFLEEALRRLPHYLAPRRLLAKIQLSRGELAGARALYEGLMSESTNPEHWSDLGAVYALYGDLAARSSIEAYARDAWERLLERFPEAMYWHASEFYLTDGRAPARAIRLLQENAKLRPNAGAWRALAHAQIADGDPVAAGASMRKTAKAQARLMRTLCH
jgi:tetratricopeptide (TPR) repeat protein